MSIASSASAVRRIGDFLAQLRSAGVTIGIDASITFVRALDVLKPVAIDDLYWAGRATLIKREDQIPIFDREFARFLDLLGDDAAGPPSPVPETTHEAAPDHRRDLNRVTSSTVADGGSGEDAPEHAEATSPDSASSAESLSVRAFEELDHQEVLEINALFDDLAHRLPRRRSRRMHRANRGRFDAATTFRASRKTMGEPLQPRFKTPVIKQRTILFIVDVSRSMEPHSRFLIRFAHILLRAGRSVEVFSFGTRLTRLTGDLEHTGPVEVVARAGRAIPDWGGGTRIGASLAKLIDRYGRRGLARGAVVVICSDGLDRGDPEELRRQMIRMKALSHRIIWINPLAADPAYKPLARGMAAALPHIDHFLGAESLADLEQLLATFRRLGAHRMMARAAAPPTPHR